MTDLSEVVREVEENLHMDRVAGGLVTGRTATDAAKKNAGNWSSLESIRVSIDRGELSKNTYLWSV